MCLNLLFIGAKSMMTARAQGMPNARMPQSEHLRRSTARRRRWYAPILFLCTLSSGLGLASLTNLITLPGSSETPPSDLAQREAHIGTIIIQHDDSRCEQLKFDNDSGKTTASTAPCENKVVLNTQGAPVPQGTVHRLDAISKSFSGR
jgi:hypothetical protein